MATITSKIEAHCGLRALFDHTGGAGGTLAYGFQPVTAYHKPQYLNRSFTLEITPPSAPQTSKTVSIDPDTLAVTLPAGWTSGANVTAKGNFPESENTISSLLGVCLELAALPIDTEGGEDPNAARNSSVTVSILDDDDAEVFHAILKVFEPGERATAMFFSTASVADTLSAITLDFATANRCALRVHTVC